MADYIPTFIPQNPVVTATDRLRYPLEESAELLQQVERRLERHEQLLEEAAKPRHLSNLAIGLISGLVSSTVAVALTIAAYNLNWL